MYGDDGDGHQTYAASLSANTSEQISTKSSCLLFLILNLISKYAEHSFEIKIIKISKKYNFMVFSTVFTLELAANIMIIFVTILMSTCYCRRKRCMVDFVMDVNCGDDKFFMSRFIMVFLANFNEHLR